MRARQRGFTLLEVVVAVALFALLMGLVYGGLGTAVKAHEAAGERVDQGARLRVVSGFLRRSLGSAFPMALAGRREWRMLFEGDAERVRYVADLPGYLGLGGLHEIELLARRDGEDNTLVMRRRPLTIDEEGQPAGEFQERLLLERFGGLALRYFGADDERSPPRWRNDWPAGQRMPELVEVRIQDATGEPWPPLVVQPKVDTVRYQGTGAVAIGSPGQQASPETEQDPAAAPVPRQ